jgi:hypothetical protein
MRKSKMIMMKRHLGDGPPSGTIPAIAAASRAP